MLTDFRLDLFKHLETHENIHRGKENYIDKNVSIIFTFLYLNNVIVISEIIKDKENFSFRFFTIVDFVLSKILPWITWKATF